LQQMDVEGTNYNMPFVMPLAGRDIQKDTFETILNQLIARHESLRTSFSMIGDQAVQRIHHDVSFELEVISAGEEGIEGGGYFGIDFSGTSFASAGHDQ
ncbi:MAG: hypothetical protein GY950_35190, partial [bacterium]|nr:hypothetical protein [bacterium]